MLKEHQKKFVISLQIFDLLAVVGSWMGAYFLRFDVVPGGVPGQLEEFLMLTPIIGLITLFFNFRNKLYNSHRFNSWYREILSVAFSNFQSLITFVLFIYLVSPTRLSRLTIVFYFAASFILMLTIRIIARNSLIRLRRKGRNLRHIYLVGHGNQLAPYAEKVQGIPDSGLNIAGWYDSQGQGKAHGIPEPEEDIFTLVEQKKVDAVVIGYPDSNGKTVEELISRLYNQVIPVMVIPNLTYSFIGSQIEDFEGVPLLKLNHPTIGITGMAIKRLFDVIVSLIALVLFSPIMLLVALLVKITSPGPVFYTQERMTRDGKVFKMLKFRSMRVNADKEESVTWTTENDPRKTAFGSFIRKTSLDELPQLLNVLAGRMSLVGPRPERPELIEKFKDEIPGYMLRHKMKAGITGWAQANGWRGNTSLKKRIEFDIYYIKNWSFALDIKIIFLTVIKGFINKNAY